jgi:hypothetical protein
MPPRLVQLARNPSPDDEVSVDTLLSMPLKTACRLTGFSSDAVYPGAEGAPPPEAA